MPERVRRPARARGAVRSDRESDATRALLESIGAAVLVARPPGRIETMNEAARELTGADVDADAEDLVASMDVRDAWTNEPARRSILRAVLAGADIVEEVSFTNPKNGERRVVQVVAHPMRARDGTITAAVAALHDLTELRRVEEQKDEFLSIVAHELRTPLTPLKALAQLQVSRIRRARERGEEPDLAALEQNLRTIERQADRLNGLVSDLLFVSRAGRGPLPMSRRPVDLATCVRDAVDRSEQATREEGRHSFVVEAPASLMVETDQARIEQLLRNLIGNAVKYSPRGGEVRVSLEREEGSVAIAIADQGIGIEPADLARLGEPFVRGAGRAATFAGMGIGLSVAKLIAEAHGGSLELASAGPDRGTTVRVHLPTTPTTRPP